MKQFIDKIAKQLEKDENYQAAEFKKHFKEMWNVDPNFQNFMIGFIERQKFSARNVPGAVGYAKPIIISRQEDEGSYNLLIQLYNDNIPSIASFTAEELDSVCLPMPLNDFEAYVNSSHFPPEDKEVLDEILSFIKERIPKHGIPEVYKYADLIEPLNDLNMLLTTAQSNVMEDFAHIAEEVLRLIPELKAWILKEESKNF